MTGCCCRSYWGFYKIYYIWTSLVIQWIAICLPVQGTWVWFLVWEDSTCCGATKTVCHNWVWVLEPASCNCWACELQLLSPRAAITEPLSCNCWARELQLLKPACLEHMLRNKRATSVRSLGTTKKNKQTLVAAAGESPCAAMKTQYSQIIYIIYIYIYTHTHLYTYIYTCIHIHVKLYTYICAKF